MIRSKLLDELNIRYYFFEKDDIGKKCFNDIFKKTVITKQIHGKKVVISDGMHMYYSGYDGIFSSEEECIGVRTADCMPILLVSKNKQFVAAIHAGWRGLYKGIIKEIVSIYNRMGITSSEILVVIGPHIKDCCYFVGKSFKRKFDERYPDMTFEIGRAHV